MTDNARGTRSAVTETDLELGDGRTLHVYDTGADAAAGRLAVFWHHGTPNIGAPPEPLFPAAARRRHPAVARSLQASPYLAIELLQERVATLGALLVVAHRPKLLR
jgi:hypothetical protein